MSNCAIVGINWGDEGKGRMVDLVTADYDVVVRYQGGGNAGHTVVNEFGKFALHLLPSGVFHKGVMNILGNGVAVDDDILDGLKFRKRQIEHRVKYGTRNLLHLFFGQHGMVFFLNNGGKSFGTPLPVVQTMRRHGPHLHTKLEFTRKNPSDLVGHLPK